MYQCDPLHLLFSCTTMSWTACALVEDAGAPSGWGDDHPCRGDGERVVRLRDNGDAAWPHALVAPDTFWFFLPRRPCPDRPREHALVAHVHERLHHDENVAVVVHLFAALGLHVEWYGVWTAVGLQHVDEHRTLLTLRRRDVQVAPAYLSLRAAGAVAHHVRVHELHVRRHLPSGWSVAASADHCAAPSVVAGRRCRGDVGAACDFLVSNGVRRVAFVSFASEAHVTVRARAAACRRRARGRCRVVLVVGVPPVWYSCGPDARRLDGATTTLEEELLSLDDEE